MSRMYLVCLRKSRMSCAKKSSYAGCPGLFLVLSVQFAIEMCVMSQGGCQCIFCHLEEVGMLQNAFSFVCREKFVSVKIRNSVAN